MTNEAFQRENEELRRRLAEAEDALAAIRDGRVDALVADGAAGPQVFSLSGAETVYRLAVETMAEATLHVTPAGTILFCNARFAELVATPLERILGRGLAEFVPRDDRGRLRTLLAQCARQPVAQRIVFRAADGALKPTHVSGHALSQGDDGSLCLVAADLTELEGSADQIEQLRQAQIELLESRRSAVSLLEDALEARRDAEQTAAALRESEARIQQALRVSHSFTFDWTPATDQVVRSASCATVLKLSGHEAVRDEGQRFFQRVHPDDREPFVQTLRNLTPASSSYTTEYRVTCGDGSVAVLEEFGQATFDAAGTLIRLVGVTTDITARRRAEEALRESRALLQAVLDNTPDPIFLKDRQSRLLLANPATLALIGKPAEAVLGQTDAEFYDDLAAAQAIMENDRRIMQSGKMEVVEESLRNAEGTHVYLSAKSPYRDNAGRVIGLVGVAREITDRKRAEEALRRSEARWNAAIENFAAGAIIATEDEQVIYWNPAAREMHGFTRPDEGLELLEKTPVTFQLWTADGSHLLELDEWPMRRIKRGETVRNLELRIRRPDQGWEKIFSYSGAMVETAGGERLIFLSVHDLTELRQVEAALRASRLAALNLLDDAVAARQQAEKTLAALRQSQEDLDRAQAVGQIGSWRLDVHRNVLTWSDENHRIFGVPPGTPLSYETFLGIVHPDDRQYVDTRWQAALRGEPYDIEHRLVVAGRLKWVREKAYLEFGDAGELLGGFGITEDITDRKRAEEEIRMLSKFPEQNPNPVLRVARDGVILYANAASAPLLTDWDVRAGDPAPPDWIQRVTAALASGKVEETEVVCEDRVYSCDLAPIIEQGYVNLYARDVTDRRRAEEQLRRAKEDWEDTFNTVPDLVAILDCQHRIVRANRAMAERLKLAPGSGGGLPCYEIVHGTSLPSHSCPHAQTCRDGQEHTVELHEPSLGGHFLVTTSPRFDELGRVTGTVHVARDITALKETEQSLQRLNAELETRVAERTAKLQETFQSVKAERQRLYDLLETLPVYVALLSTDYHVPFANRFFRERFGESQGRRCFEFLFERSEPCENCETYKVLSTHAPGRWEWTGPDGRDYDIYDFPFVDTDGSTLILEMGIDITARKKAQRALESSEARYRSFVTASTQLSWTTDAQGLVTEDMPSWRAFTGQTRAQIQGWGWADALHPEDRQPTAAVWSQAVATGSLYAVEYRLRRHDGQYRWLSVRGVPVMDGGAIREWVGACTDITDRRSAEEESRRMRDELARADRVARMGELTASLAHELNQPLAAILSNAQAARRFLAADSPDLNQFREILDDIIQDDKRAGSVIHRLRLMLQKGRPEPETFHMNDAVREVLQLLHSEAVGRNATLAVDLATTLPAVLAGRIEVQQVLVNLLLNALDAVKDVPSDRREVLVRTRFEQDTIVVSVRDRGCGIPPADINNVFEPFFTTKPTGLGMGLAICRRMMQTHGGRIWAANNEDTGVTVSFSLPSAPASTEPSDA